MNTYIMSALSTIEKHLTADRNLSSLDILSVIGELEMMKMEIEQHLTNMAQNEEYENMRISAKNAVQKLSELLDLLEELPDDKGLVDEIIELIKEIRY